MALWNFTIDDTSPYISYSPFVDGPSGWKTWYSDSQYNEVPDEVGRGDSYHVASRSNASVTVRFYGSGISLFGSANSSFNVVVDNILRASISDTPTSLLYSNYDFMEGLHSVTINAHPSNANSSLVGFDFAIASSPLGLNENPPSPLFYDSSDTTSLLYSGPWSINHVNDVPNSTISAPFRETTEGGASVSLSFTGGTAVAVRGMTGAENGLYSVSLDGSMGTFNGSSVWIVPDALLFFLAGLDPGVTHELNITNINAGTRLCLNSMTVFRHESKVSAAPSAPTTPATSSGSVGIGAIIGPIAGLLVLGAVGAYILCRRRHLRQSIKIPASRLDPFMQSGGISPHTLNNSQPPSGANSDAYPSSPAGPPGGAKQHPDLYEANRKRQAYVLMSSHGQSDSSLARVWHLNSPFIDYTNTPHASHTHQTEFFDTSESHLPRRKPLPTIPVPSYNAALQAPELTSEEVKSAGNLLGRYIRPKTQETAPPQYEQ